ncbi:hypothetical protein [Moritella dasanensis]|uniref:hypothetical protein n=1 Tax=Moritella dasanensis TaxID=428031 RepID=UPI0002D4C51C|nr:hypothetical protein [Moritella dasanensis]
MAKSKTREAAKSIMKRKTGNIKLLEPDIIKIKQGNQITLFDFNILRREGTFKDARVVKSYKKPIDKLKKRMYELRREGQADITLYPVLYRFKRYMFLCYKWKCDPFSEDGYRNYHTHLRQRIECRQAHKPLWQYQDGEEVGITEGTAGALLTSLRKALGASGVFKQSWDIQLSIFSKSNIPFTAYSSSELDVIIRRLLTYFTQLTQAIIETGNPNCTVAVNIDGVSWEVKSNTAASGFRKEIICCLSSAFNQAMVAAYYLTAYFTAFNTCVLEGLCRPLIRTSTTKDERTKEWVELFGTKVRAKNKDVTAIMGGDVTEGKVKKSGLSFITLLETLSTEFHRSENGLLLYLLDSLDHPLVMTSAKLKGGDLAANLGLYCDKRAQCVPALKYQFFMLLNENFYDRIIVDENSIVHRNKTKNKAPFKRLNVIAHLLIDAVQISSVRLKDICFPIKIRDEKGMTIALFHYFDRSEGELIIPAEHRDILDLFISWKLASNSLGKIYLFSYISTIDGRKNRLSPFMGYGFSGYMKDQKVLSNAGLSTSDYLIDLTSSRFRETAAMVARKKQGSGLAVSVILQNALATQYRSYNAEHPETNMRVMSQSMQVLERLRAGDLDIEAAKEALADDLGIPVLTIDECRAKNGKANIAGTFCKPGSQHPQHTAQVKRANGIGLDKRYQLSCTQYDKCIGCKHAKLVDDVDAIYRLLSFTDLLSEAEEHYPGRYQQSLAPVVQKIHRVIHANIPKNTVKQAVARLDSQGRHPYWNAVDNLTIPIRI